MENNLKGSLLTVCQLLEKHNVEYMLVGRTALNGYYRHSINIAGELTDKPDIDIWYNPTYGNYFNILKVMDNLGQDITEFKNEQSPNPRNSFIRLDFDSFTLDLLPEVKAKIRFSDASQRKEKITFDEIQIIL